MKHKATSCIVGICCVMWGFELLFGQSFYRLGIFEPNVGVYQIYRFVTSLFLHDPKSPLHLLFNMIALVSAGSVLERVLGAKKYCTLYFVSGIFGNIFMLIWSNLFINGSCIFDQSLGGSGFIGNGCSFSLGASGAIFGLFGALVILYRKIGANANNLIIIVAVNLFIGFSLSGIAWQAHIGGFIAGLLTAHIIYKFVR